MTSRRDLFLKTVTRFHEAVFRSSNGKLLARGAGMPVLMLTTVGRKSGKPRTTMLTAPLVDGETIVIVASKGGDENHPAWFLNLKDDPAVGVMMNGETREMTARIANADDRAALWPRIVAEHANYAGYQTKTDREIPVVLLEPVV